ncbi:hypothetical protein cyc_06824 [Cyclospora cayetanensis]|uniref:Ankyrin repeat-containing protein n=1 Tax=Cyclospora cayetanensis TaxID=88456 RepID=A0A1D3CVN1_9EIME|nr:hypothetical protein cyc_06824 [Cyclospora cayetanensis]
MQGATTTAPVSVPVTSRMADDRAPSGDECVEKSSWRYNSTDKQWLLQAADAVFGLPSMSPDIWTEEPEGERRPLILVALAEAIQHEAKLRNEAREQQQEVDDPLLLSKTIIHQKWKKNFDMVRLLLAHGASLDKPSEAGVFPLEYSIKKHSMQATTLLLSASQCYTNDHQWLFPLPHELTPLHLASADNDLSLASLLLNGQPDGLSTINARCRKCSSTAVAFTYLPEAPSGLLPERAVRVQLPLCRNCLVNARDAHGCTSAFYSGSRRMLRLLLDSGTNLDARCRSGDTLLHALVYNAFRNVDPPATSLWDASKKLEEPRYAAPITCNCTECSGIRGSSAAALCRIGLLLERIQLRASNNGDTVLKNSTEVQAFVNRHNKAGWTALHIAAARGYSDVCRVLLELGADASLRTMKRKLTPKDLALLRNHHETAR